MTTKAKNWILRPYLDSAHWIEEESTVLATDTFCVLLVAFRYSKVAPAQGIYGRVEVKLHSLFTSVWVGVERSYWGRGLFRPEKQASILFEQETGGVSKSAWMFGKGYEIECPCRHLNPRLFSPEPSHYTDYVIPVPTQPDMSHIIPYVY
jgi:hypothetical protein